MTFHLNTFYRTALICALGLIYSSQNVPGAAAEAKAKARILELTNVWNVHLKFTAAEWEAMEPKGGGFGPGGPGGRGFGPAMFIAPAFMSKADENKDGLISKTEFEGLGDRLFKDWDAEKRSKLNATELREGINKSFASTGGGVGISLQGAAGSRNGLASATGVEFKYVRADLEFDGKTFSNVGVRYKGNGTFMMSRGSTKRSFKVDLDHYFKDANIGGLSTLNLHNNVTDPSWMNEPLSHRLYRDAGVPAPRSSYARVYITVPAKHDRQYFGLYSIVENVDRDLLADRFGSKKGAILKPVTRTPFEYMGEDWKRYEQPYDAKGAITQEQKQRVIALCKLVSQGSDADFASKIGDYVDLDEFARFMAVTVWLSTLDSILSIGQNYVVLMHPKTQKLQFVPWDLDHSFGQFGLIGSQDLREKLSINKPWQGQILFLERMFKVEAFKKLYLAKMEEFNKSIFRPERFVEQVDTLAKVLRPAIQEEGGNKVARFDKVTSGEPVEAAGFGGGGPGGGGPGSGAPGGGGPGGPPMMGPSKPIKGFVKARSESVAAQLAGKAQGETLDRSVFGGGRMGPPPPGMILGGPFFNKMDSDKDGEVSQGEFTKTFAKWFADWNTDKSGNMTDDQLREGINKDLSFFGMGGPGGPGGPGPGGPVRVPIGGPRPPQ